MTQYYIQRYASGFLGNSPIWWAKKGNGYSAYLENAERFSKEDADKILIAAPEKYAMYPCDFIDAHTHKVFDMQDFRLIKQYETKLKVVK